MEKTTKTEAISPCYPFPNTEQLPRRTDWQALMALLLGVAAMVFRTPVPLRLNSQSQALWQVPWIP
ncbi:hypothetical protein HSBAA_31250 [Vreelandella sulfidaeris]|uniref:Uncharacterized protein n=1 Tax=Vreelandella sulfidaeris TaxID=115553 RepID=A0A455UBA8_9GAMM|nr:hypothetical protein HSBAA_31250 [Halomonas sulfidaeris]